MNSRSILPILSGFLAMIFLCACVVGILIFTMDETEVAGLQDVLEQPSVAVEGELSTPMPTPDIKLAEPIVAGESESPLLPRTIDGLAIVRAEEEVFNRVYEHVSPGVVNIRVRSESQDFLPEEGEGSGFVWDKEGHIVTNNHVVENAANIWVTFSDTTQATAEIVGTNPDSDLAVIRVNVDPDLLRPVLPADSAALRVGQRVIAIGNPFGFDRTLTIGVVSALGRTVPGQMSEQGRFSLPNLVQTDAAINPGNSGGPLLDIEGRVIGVNTLIFSSTPQANSGVGFAVPVNKVKAVIPALIQDGIYKTPYLGISSASDLVLTPKIAEELGLQNVTSGILIDNIVPGGPSHKADLRGSEQEIEVSSLQRVMRTGGDVITKIDEQVVQQFDDLINYLDTQNVGDVVTLTIIRNGEELQVPVTLGARPN